ncbi:MAG: phage Gp37/Gp68 family protein [Hyphomonadaceae bacterium]|nr:phage Gp37/Gp68 family protein [Hyphomonadaceae bacterium]
MADDTGIEWADATWNPIVGCSIVSPGCTHCYAMRFANARLDGNPKTPHYADTTQRVNGAAVWTGKVAPAPEHVLTQPLRWKRPRRIFVNSMGDLFHEAVPNAWIDEVYQVMQGAPQHTFLILTKRAQRMRDYHVKLCADVNAQATRAAVGLPDFPLRNVWLGVSCEDQARADERVPLLLDTPAALRFASAEPLLGPIDFNFICDKERARRVFALNGAWEDRGGVMKCPRLDWIIAGGESGKGARPMHPDWARSLRDGCATAGVPFFFKQWGEWAPVAADHDGPAQLRPWANTDGRRGFIARLGKRAAGRTLDGATHDAFPEAQ